LRLGGASYLALDPVQRSATRTVDLPPGVHPVTLRIDAGQRQTDLKLELVRPEGSPAEFAVVDGQ
jgi:hypothetical protein